MRDGHRVSLREALVATAPRGFSINLPNAGAWADTPVSWRGHRSFAEVLQQILADHPDLFADVDTDLRLVTITKRAADVEPDALAVASSSEGKGAGSGANAVVLPSSGQSQAFPSRQARLLPERAPADPSYSAATLIAKQPPMLAWSGAGTASAMQPTDVGAATRRLGDASAATRKTEVAPSLQHTPMQAAQRQPEQPPAAEAASVAPRVPTTVRAWHIAPADRSVRTALARWASEAGWQFVWDVPTDFSIDASATINGTLEDALNAVAQALKRSQVPIQVILYKGNKVIRVVGEGAA
ncbi:MAG: TcpQ domain-containing protein [Trinickia sp.]